MPNAAIAQMVTLAQGARGSVINHVVPDTCDAAPNDMEDGLMTGIATAQLRSLVYPIGGLLERCNLRAIRRRRVAEVCLVLLNLVQDLQLHRGLSGAVLTGQGGFRAELDAVQHKLQRSLHALAEYYGDRHPVFRQAQWRIVLGRWESLRNNWRGLGFDTNLSVHGDVVTGVLGILRVLASDNAQLLGRERAQAIKSWPTLVEQFAMLRALGLQILACDGPADTGKQDAMCARVQSARLVLQTIAPSVDDKRMLDATAQALAFAQGVVNGSHSTTNAEIFYAQTTGVIDDWYRLIRTRIGHQI
jgi:hypothetical protein